MQDDSQEFEEWVFLIGCRNDQEASMIESFLTYENISVLRKYRGAGDYLKIACGMTIFGIDLFVKKFQSEIAKEIVCDVIGTMEITDEPDKADSKIEGGMPKGSTTAIQNIMGKKRLFLISGIALIFIFGYLVMTIFQQ